MVCGRYDMLDEAGLCVGCYDLSLEKDMHWRNGGFREPHHEVLDEGKGR